MKEKYPLLYGYSDKGCTELHGIEEVAKYIVTEGQNSDLTIVTHLDTVLLNTFGTFIDRISDMDYRNELLEILIPLQQQLESGAFDAQDDEGLEMSL